MNNDYQIILDLIAQTIFDKKGSNILVLDLRGISTITDFVVIAEGNVDRHVIAIGQAVEQALKEQGIRPVYVEGMQSGDWVVLDYLRVMVHIFMPGLRDKYQLETLWKTGKIVDVHIDVHQPQPSAVL
jgi:ribosome-associated protein